MRSPQRRSPGRQGRRRPCAVVAAVCAVAVVSGCSAADGSADASQPQERVAAEAQAPVRADVRKLRSIREVPAVPVPRRLRIPKLGVDTLLEQLGRRTDRTVEVPRNWQRAGWYREGPRPGEPGSAVVLGHVDSPQGPAVFSGLARLPRGARIHIDRADGSTVTFRVTRVEEHLRSDFPTELVYLPTLDRELRLITCAGRYIRSRGGYQSNVVVFATASRELRAGG